MSQLLAALTGPAFYPLPGIGHMVTLDKNGADIALERSKKHAKEVELKANKTTAAILELLKECERTFEILADMLDISETTVKRHVKLLKKEKKVAGRRSGNTVYWRATNA